MKIFIDPVYYHNPRGIGLVTRKIHHQIIKECNCDLIFGTNFARVILKLPLLFIIWEQAVLPLYLRFKKVDLYFATGGTGPYFLPKNTKQILWVHDLYYLEPHAMRERKKTLRRRLGQLYRKALLEKVLHNSHEVVAISEFTRRRILELTHFRKDIMVIYNQVDEAGIVSSKINKQEICVIFTGAAENKNPYFVRSLLELMNQYELTFQVVVLGLPVHLQVPSNKIEYHHFLPQRELDSLLSESKVSVIPSNYEGFGLPVVESIFHGCIPLTSNIPVFKEINPFFCRLSLADTETAFSEIQKQMLSCNEDHNIYLTRENFRGYNAEFASKIRQIVVRNA